MATLNARLEKLEMVANPKAPSLTLILVQRAGSEQDGEDDKITGNQADGCRPALERLQGESVDGLTDRARKLITGGFAVIHYARDPAPMWH
jgi:hypothetical protein